MPVPPPDAGGAGRSSVGRAHNRSVTQVREGAGCRKLPLLTNHKPVVTGTDEGIWRRLPLVPWDVVIPAAERDEQLGDRLAGELPAVLAWLAAGYRDWRQTGLAEPGQVEAATSGWRRDSDPLGRFLDQRCILATACHAGSADLYTAWCKWCADEGHDPGTQTTFSTALINRGYDKRKSHGVIRWAGIGLAASD